MAFHQGGRGLGRRIDQIVAAVASLFTVLSSAGASYSTSRNVLASDGTPYAVSGNVLSSGGTSYAVI